MGCRPVLLAVLLSGVAATSAPAAASATPARAAATAAADRASVVSPVAVPRSAMRPGGSTPDASDRGGDPAVTVSGAGCSPSPDPSKITPAASTASTLQALVTAVEHADPEEIATTLAAPAALPVVLFLVVFLYLQVEDIFDRRDPKLARAPMQADPRVPFLETAPLPGSAVPAAAVAAQGSRDA